MDTKSCKDGRRRRTVSSFLDFRWVNSWRDSGGFSPFFLFRVKRVLWGRKDSRMVKVEVGYFEQEVL